VAARSLVTDFMVVPEGGGGLDQRSAFLLEALLPVLCGPSLGPSKMVKALVALQDAQEVRLRVLVCLYLWVLCIRECM